MSRVGEIPAFDEIIDVAQSRGADSEAPDLWTGLVGGWPFAAGGGLTAFDVSGYGHHGTLTNMDPATDWVMTEKGWMLELTAASSQYLVGTPALLPDGGDFSFASWIRNDLTGSRTLFGEMPASTSRIRHLCRVDGANMEYDNYSPSGGVVSVNVGLTTALTHVAFVRRGTSIEFWVNGQLKGSGVPDTYDGAAPIQWRIGDYASVQFFDGLIGGPCVYSRPLLPSEIQQLYSDPWAMYRLRSEVFPAAVAGVVVPWHLLIQGAA